ncbi:2,3-epoxybenzoyl-CoA dihydrolase [Actinomycetospora endophytica]|uniref:2,3-epoxybenzoyl-CoA dihydrolase n=1 Tax=Actinomycetospora endophytica TaxID=2291215 RepID=A0ABS8PCM8_9PSEU|nr:2,3-epoxybenzoyl-CoA dihydrolase [Actinomycetospora endophytica]MCD2196034.1 2,3-epoxybenzoyl-CoA dihydrolase [Actinomycetospora endophytica]
MEEPVNAVAEHADEAGAPPRVDFDTGPERYRHWRYTVDGETAWVYLDVAEDGGIVPGYELKLNSYDLGVDIELYDLTQRLRFSHPQVRSVVLTSGKDSNFCAGANIRMLAGSSHPWKVNFCKFTNETRNGIEDMTDAGQTWIAALNGTAAGGGYEMALACDQILLVDDRSSAVSLPEVPLLGVLPGTGGLTRVIDKRKVRKDRADVFATKSEGFGGRKAVEWKLVDEAVPRREWERVVAERAAAAAAASTRQADAQGIELPPLRRDETADTLTYDHVRVTIDRDARTATVVVAVPDSLTDDPAALHDQGAAHPLLAITRELDDAILRLRTNELEIGTWLLLTEGPVDAALAADRLIANHQDDWLVAETTRYLKRVFKRLDVTSRSLIALVEPGSCFAGPFLELALACDRQYMLEGTFEEDEDATLPSGAAAEDPATLVVTDAQFGTFPMGNGLTRLGSRFYGDDDALEAVREKQGEQLEGGDADDLGLVTDAPDDIDWTDEIRILLEERASLSPDALTGMEANHRFVGPETMETRIFGRLTAWQNWIFIRPNASGPEGALRKYGTGRKADFDQKRV